MPNRFRLETPRSIAVRSALEAGRTLRSYFGNLTTVDFKGEIDIVTEADRAAEEIVLGRIRTAFPDDAILAEESGSRAAENGSDRRWVVDPLDGTTNFANSYPHFCVSIALEIEEIIQLGVVYVPMLEELFIAERGAGATVNGRQIRVSSEQSLLNSVVSTGFEYSTERRGRNLPRFAHFTHTTRAVRRDGSAAIDLCYVAAGRFDGFWEAGLSPWDVAAGSLMVTEAGGTITDYAGNSYRIDAENCIATNGHIHREMRSGIQTADERAFAK
jgi:myo-inositol-1(or 4)-monophosphatase